MADEETTSVTEAEVEAVQETESPTEVEKPEEPTEETSTDDAPEEGGEDAEETPESDDSEEEPEAEPTDPKEAARRGYAERTRIRTEVAQALNEIDQPVTAQDLIEQGQDPALAEIEALKADIQRKEAVNYVTELNSGLNTDAVQVIRDFPIFNAESPDYDEKFTQEVESFYKRAAGFQMDPSGRFVTQANMPLYDFYQWVMDVRNSGQTQAVVKGQKAAEKMLASSETPSSAQSRAGEEDDPFLKGLLG